MTVSLAHISKVFTQRPVLSDVSLTFEPGRIYALLGENGAGKSTLVHILSGLIEPSEGALFLDGKKTNFRSPQDAISAGIVMVHQRPLLADTLSVWENAVIGCEPVAAGFILRTEEIHDSLEIIKKKWELEIDIDSRVSSLTATGRLYAALLAALWRTPRLLILDEPSAALAPAQRSDFFIRVRRAADEGLSIVLITHSLDEALSVSDRIAVLRGGKLAANLENPEINKSSPGNSAPSEETLRSYMFGADETLPNTKKERECLPFEKSVREPVFIAEDVTVTPPRGISIYGVSFSVSEGELAVITGKRESGLETLEDILTGMSELSGSHRSRRHVSGRIHLGSDIFGLPPRGGEKRLTTRTLRALGMGIVPSDRAFRGSDPRLSVQDILSIHRQTSLRKGPFMDKKALKDFAVSLIQAEGINAAPEQLAGTLSGGMLQRLILARELAEHPRILFMAEPSWGLDIQSSAFLWEKLRSAAAAGTAVLVLTTDTDAFYSSSGERIYRLESGTLCSGDSNL